MEEKWCFYFWLWTMVSTIIYKHYEDEKQKKNLSDATLMNDFCIFNTIRDLNFHATEIWFHAHDNPTRIYVQVLTRSCQHFFHPWNRIFTGTQLCCCYDWCSLAVGTYVQVDLFIYAFYLLINQLIFHSNSFGKWQVEQLKKYLFIKL